MKFLLGSIEEDFFFKEHYDKNTPLFISNNNPNNFDSILLKKQIQNYLLKDDISVNSVNGIKKDHLGSTKLPLFNPLSLDKKGLALKYNNGITIELLGVDRSIKSLEKYRNKLEKKFNSKIDSSVFISKINAHEKSVKFRHNSSFILQISGSQNWKLLAMKVKNSESNVDMRVLKSNNLEYSLTSGDLLFIPCGFESTNCNKNDNSIHLEFSIIVPTWFEIFQIIISQFKKNREFRKAYIPHFLNSDPKQQFNDLKSLVKKSVTEKTTEDIFNDLIPKHYRINTCWLSQYQKLDSLNINSKLNRSDREIKLKIDDSLNIVILYYDNRKIQYPLFVYKTLISIISQKNTFDLKSISSEMDVEDLLDLVSELVEEGLLKL